MSTLPSAGIREVLLAVIAEQTPKSSSDQTLQQGSVLDAAARRLNVRANPGLKADLLTEWYDLFRTGLPSWGMDLANPKQPFFHVTGSGHRVLEHLSRDPSNPDAYLRHLSSIAVVSPIAESYLREALDCYRAGLVKAGAVMTGVAAESVLLDLRDEVVRRLGTLDRAVPEGLGDWRAKTVADALRQFFEQQRGAMPRELVESFEAHWRSFTHQVRTTRNDAGHPVSAAPVTADMVHASLLVFPEFARLATALKVWMTTGLH